MKVKSYILGLAALCISQGVMAHDISACETHTAPGIQYTACKFDPSQSDIRLFLGDNEGQVLGSFEAVNAALSPEGEQLSFAMTGGMYHKDRSPVGLYLSLIHI